MKTGPIWLLVSVLLLLGLLLSVAVGFFRSSSRSITSMTGSSSVALQIPVPNAAPQASLPTQAENATPSSPPVLTSTSNNTPTYQYNAQGQLQTIIYPDGSTYTYQYNLHGDKISEINSRTGKTWSYVYDQNHHPLSVIDPEGRVTRTEAPPAAPNAP